MSTHVTPVGSFAFPSLNEPRENLNKKLEWSVGIVLTEESATDVLKVIEAVIAEERARNPRFPKDDSVLNIPVGANYKKNEAGEKEIIPGQFLIRFKRPYELKGKRTGDIRINSAPVIYDGSGQLVSEPPNIGNGTEGKIIYRAFAYDNVQKGVGLYLMGAQIYKLNTGEEAIKLAPIEGGWVAEESQQTEETSLAALLAGG